MPFPFNASPRPTLGIEEEYQICDPASGDLVPVAHRAMAEADPELARYLSYDLLLGLIEVNTDVAEDVEEGMAMVLDRRRRVQALVEELGCTLGMTGTHPFAVAAEQRTVDTEAYRWVYDQLRYVAQRNLTFGMHVHVGVDDADRAIYVANRMRQWIGPLIALSANSPFLDGVDTGWESARCYAFGAFPRAAMPPRFRDWSDFEGQIERFMAADSITRPRQIWWNVRAHPSYGTVEVRCCDMQASLRRTASLVALVQALVVTYAEAHRRGEREPKMPRADLEDGRFKGMRFGLEGRVIDPVSGEALSMRDYIRQMLEVAGEAAADLGTTRYLRVAEEVLEEGTGSARQRQLASQLGGDLRAVQRRLLETARTDGIDNSDLEP